MKRKIISTEHPTVVRLLHNIVNDTPVKKSGTYNRADPTYFEKGEQVFEYKGKRFYFKYNDCTWGIEIEIGKLIPRFDYSDVPKEEYHPFWDVEKEIAGFYISRENRINPETRRWSNYDNVIFRQGSAKGTLKLLALAFKEVLMPNFKSQKEIEYERQMNENNEPWIDPAGGVHWGYEGDHTRMYE